MHVLTKLELAVTDPRTIRASALQRGFRALDHGIDARGRNHIRTDRLYPGTAPHRERVVLHAW